MKSFPLPPYVYNSFQMFFNAYINIYPNGIMPYTIFFTSLF